MGPTWDPPGSCRLQMGPMNLAIGCLWKQVPEMSYFILQGNINWKTASYPNDLNLFWPGDAIWRNKSWSTLVQVMAWCLTAVFQITASPSARSRQLWRRTGNFFKTFLQFYVYDLRFNAAGLTILLIEFWTLLTALSHYLNQCWLIISEVLWAIS